MNIQQIKNSVDLLALVEMVAGRGIREGTCVKFFSPFREEKNPSFAVYPDGRWFDFGLGEGGDVISFAMKYWNLSFKEAVEKLMELNGAIRIAPERENKPPSRRDRRENRKRAEALYRKLLETSDATRVEGYFREKGVNYHPHIGAVLFPSIKQASTYVAIPSPYPQKVLGLECRKIEGGGLGRLTLFGKPLWLLKRNLSRMLLTESILDSLAGEIILNDRDLTLVALNGVGNKSKVPGMVRKYSPRIVLLALDADDVGQKTQNEIAQSISSLTRIRCVDDHVKAGVKDLHRLLVSQKERRES